VECPNLFDRARSIFHPLGSSRRRNRSSSSMPRTRGSSSAPRRRFSSGEFAPIDGSSFIHVTCVTCPVAGEITIRQAQALGKFSLFLFHFVHGGLPHKHHYRVGLNPLGRVIHQVVTSLWKPIDHGKLRTMSRPKKIKTAIWIGEKQWQRLKGGRQRGLHRWATGPRSYRLLKKQWAK
jgi:hypothetical protein